MKLEPLIVILLLMTACQTLPNYKDRRLTWWDCINNVQNQIGSRGCTG